MGGFPRGTKLKNEKDLHRNGIRVYLTDSEAECLFGLCREWDETMSVAIRTCVKMVSGMDEGQRTRLFLRSE